MGNVLKIRDGDGNFIGIDSIKGDDGKSAYEQAVEGGYIGTEEEFSRSLIDLPSVTGHTTNKDNPHGVTCDKIKAFGCAGVFNGSGDINTANKANSFYVIVRSEGVSNLPEGMHDNSTLHVQGQGSNALMQILYSVQQKSVFRRTFTSGETPQWSDWYTIYDELNKPTPQEIGAVSTHGTIQASNLLEWAREQTLSGAFLTDPAITMDGLPTANGRFIGTLDVTPEEKRIFASDLETGISYAIGTSEGEFPPLWMEFCNAKDVMKSFSVSSYQGSATNSSGVNNPTILAFSRPVELALILGRETISDEINDCQITPLPMRAFATDSWKKWKYYYNNQLLEFYAKRNESCTQLYIYSNSAASQFCSANSTYYYTGI